MLLHDLENDGLIQPPSWLANNTAYLVQMGSAAFGVADAGSDCDVQGFAMPPLEMVFPSLRGEIPGFGRATKPFSEWVQHHIDGPDTSYDFTLWSIVRFFDLLRTGNPNAHDTLYAPETLILHSTAIGDRVRERRSLFLSRRVLNTFRGSAAKNRNYMMNRRLGRFVALCQQAQLDANVLAQPGMGVSFSSLMVRLGEAGAGELVGLMREAERDGGWSKRLPLVIRHGYDVRFAYHLVRLLLECEQLLTTGEMDVQRDAAVLRAIRAGEWPVERVNAFFETKSTDLDAACQRSRLPAEPDETAIRDFLFECLEAHYGSLRGVTGRAAQREEQHVQ